MEKQQSSKFQNNKEEFDLKKINEIDFEEIIENADHHHSVHDRKPWQDKTTNEKIKSVALLTIKLVLLLICLYCFIVSLELMTSAFRLIAGRNANKVFDNKILENPLAGLMLGVIATVLVQSSSTATSIVVSLVAAGIIPKISIAIPIIMGANIGTSVTGVLVSFAQVTNKERFRLSFSGATVNDMFNILSVLVFLPLELVSHYLEHVTGLIVVSTNNNVTFSNPNFLHYLTDPLVHLIIQLDKEVLKNLGSNTTMENATIINHYCKGEPENKCVYLFESVKLPEWAIGLIILVASLTCLCICLVGMVKVLSSLFKGSIAKLLQNVVNADLPGNFKYFTGYLAIIIGCILTILVQSSSVFISSLNPLVGMGLVSIERIFPLTLGSNIGTTVTGLIAAFASSSTSTPEQFQSSLRIALCHTLFNISGILLWYPIPFIRNLPIFLAKELGNISAEYRWFALVYLLGVFFLVPFIIFGLSMAGDIVFWCVISIVIILTATVVVINVMQTKFLRFLPEFLKTWNFLPLYLRSLKPYDKVLRRTICRCKRFDKIEVADCDEKITEVITQKNQVTKF